MSGRDAIDQVMQETGLQLIMKSERIKPDFVYKSRPVSAVDPLQPLYPDPEIPSPQHLLPVPVHIIKHHSWSSGYPLRVSVKDARLLC
jgi:hypothetical protein